MDTIQWNFRPRIAVLGRMNSFLNLGAWIKKALGFAISALCVFILMWGILYKLFLPFTPLWLDEITGVAVLVAGLGAWAIGKATSRSNRGDERSVQPADAVPDAATQLSSQEPAQPE